MNLDELNVLANKVVNQPWGAGIDVLKDNSEASPPYYRFLHAVVKKYKPNCVIECGTYMGVGAMHLAAGYRSTHVITIDNNPHPKLYSYMSIFPNITLILGNTTDDSTYKDVSKLVGNNKCVGLIFIDSEHDGFTAQKELAVYRNLFCYTCLVACDDILDSRMQEFWAKLPGEKQEMNFLHTAQYPGMPDPGFGVCICRQ